MFGLIPWKRTRQPELSRPEGWSDPWESSFLRLREEMDRLFQRFLGTDLEEGEKTPARLFPWEGWFEGLQDQGDHYLVRMAAPGFEPEEFDVSLSGNRLVIRAEHKEEKKEGNGGYHYGSIHQVITLPEGADPERIEARYHSGVLEVRVPKCEEARPKRIPVKG